MANVDINFTVDCSVLVEVPDDIASDPEKLLEWSEDYVTNLSDEELLGSVLLEDSDAIILQNVIDSDTCEELVNNNNIAI